MASAKEPHRLEQISFHEIHSPLLAYRNNVASQDGEDGVIERIFQIVEPENRFSVEFGAWDGKLYSNTWNLIENQDWGGAFIEGNPEKFKDLQATYAGRHEVTSLNCFVEFDGPNSLDNILDEVNAPIDLDFISIDVDGTDYFIWEGLARF